MKRHCILTLALLAAGASVLAADGEKNLAGNTRDFYALISSMDSKKAEERAKLAQTIKTQSPTAPADWLKRIGDKQKSLRTRFEGLMQGANAAGLAAQLLPELDARRKTALDFIGSDAYTKEAQGKVDEMVRKVDEIWSDAYGQFLARNESARRALEDVKELDGYLALYPAPENPPALDEKKLRESFNSAARDAWTPKESVVVLNYNDEQKWMEEEERIHLKRLNEYRVMMGRAALEADVRLLSAARGHSRDMKEKNFFSHESPLPGKKSFVDRAVLEGYRGASGENIYMGSSSGLSAFKAWYHSPGHHKNMIGSRQIGAGRFENHWTQVFGNDGPFATRGSGKPPQIAFYEKVLALPKDASVQQRLDLAQFAVQNKLWEGARTQLNEVLKAEPNHTTAKKVLAFVEGELSRVKKK